MISFSFNTIIISVILFCSTFVCVAQLHGITTINIPLSKPITWANRELYTDFIHMNRTSGVKVKFSNINKNVSFIIFQVHSHLYNVTVYNNTYIQGLVATGTNVGLYSRVDPVDMYYILNQNDVDLNLLISVHGYTGKDPIPGGCNMEFPIPVTAFMNTNFQKDVVIVDAAPPMQYNDPDCVASSVDTEFYLMYLPERDFDAETYFDGIKKMMSYDNIKENGDRITKGKWPMRRVMSAYPGTGSIYVVIATSKEDERYYSIYIPSHSYACSPLDEDGCELIDDMLSRFICASLIFVGVFMCYFGHRFFKTEMFLFGLLSGVIITYIIISLISLLEGPALIAGSLLSGVFFGAIWLTFWWYYGIPVIAVSLPTLNLGFLVSAIIYNKFPGDLIVLQEDFNFWTLFILLMLLTSLILVSVAFISNILCCAVLGAYAVVYAMDFYLGSNIKYIVINTIRRAVVPKFNRALLMPPFEWRDAIIVVFWIALAVSGFLFQHYHNRGRPPFPPPPRSVRPGRPEPSGYGALPSIRNVTAPVLVSSPVIDKGQDERTPLLA